MSLGNNGSNVPARNDDRRVPTRRDDAPYAAHERSAAPGSSGFDWERYVSTIRRYKWIILLLTLVGTGAGLAVAHWMPAKYLAQSTLWIEWRDGRGQAGATEGPIQSAELLESYNWMELLESYSVLEHVAREQRLYLEPDTKDDATALSGFEVGETFTPGTYRVTLDRSTSEYVLWSRDSTVMERDPVDESTGGMFGFQWAPGSDFDFWSRDSTVMERGPVGDSIGRRFGFRWAPEEEDLTTAPVEFTLVHTRDAARGLRDDLRTWMLERGSFLKLELTGTDPQRIEGIVNGVADRFTSLATDLKRAKVEELTTMLEAQLASAEEDLAEAEAELEAFRVSTAQQPGQQALQGSSSSGQDGGESGSLAARYQDTRFEIEELQQQRSMIRSAVENENASGVGVDMLTTIPAVQRSSALSSTIEDLTLLRAELRVLLQLYTREHEDVQRLEAQIEELHTRTIPELAANLAGQLGTRQQQLREELQSMGSELQGIPPRETQTAQLERRVRISEELYTTLKSRYEESRLAAASTLPDVQVLDAAEVGRQPISDDGPQVIAMAFGASLALALLGALLFDRMDSRVRYPQEVSEGMGLRILGTIPRLKAKRGILDVHDAGAVTEAFRSLRLNLSHAHGAAGPIVTTVTSPSAGDGKSFVSLNLALTYAQLGLKTLVIDGDIRRGRLYWMLERRRKPGLTDYVSNGMQPKDIIQSTDYENLEIIATGSSSEDAPELLQTERMRDLVTHLRSEYEAIIVDSPPLAAGVDPLVLSTFTGNLLLVLRAGTTKRALAEAKLDIMSPLPIRILGAVLNDVGQQEAYYKYYGNGTEGYQIHNRAVEKVSAKLLEAPRS